MKQQKTKKPTRAATTKTAAPKLPKGCTIQRINVPPAPGPFINAKIISLGHDASGTERFWASTFNETSGTVGILADEKGSTRTYRFGPEHACFYSAAPQDTDTLWLCGDLSRLVRLKLSTGKVDVFPTGAHDTTGSPRTPFTHLLHTGMVFDKPTGRLFAAARPPHGTTGFSFDSRTKKSVIYRDQWDSLFHYNSFSNGDGSWTIVFFYPAALMRWDPVTQRVTKSAIDITSLQLDTLYSLASDPRYGIYLPSLGWYDAINDKLTQGPRPQRECMWLAARGDTILGARTKGSDLAISKWNLTTGEVADIVQIPETPLKNVTVSQAGNIVAMSLDGEFRVYDSVDMGLKLARRADSDSVGKSMCLRLIKGDRIVGSTFITQRFWQGDIKTGKSTDLGRAAPGVGQITNILYLRDLIYMTAYTGGELVEYNPDRPAAFPTNPRVVAQHPLAMRPITCATDGRHIWYACSRHYGIHGSVLFRYDTHTGQASWNINPLGPRQIMSMVYDPATNALICGSTIHCDQAFAPAKEKLSATGLIDADDLTVRAIKLGPTLRADAIGWLRKGVLLFIDHTDDRSTARLVTSATLETLDTPMPTALTLGPRGAPLPITTAGKTGLFLLRNGQALELHDLRKKQSLLRSFSPPVSADSWHVDGDDLLVLDHATALIVRNALKV
jgi:hypothetical protein